MKLAKISIFVISFALAVVANADNIWVMAKEGSWEPNEKILSAIQTDIEVYVKKETMEQGRQLLSWNKYMFQYLAVELKGKKHILINAICGKRDPKELENFHLTSGGGNCYFNLKYDPEKEYYYDLFINGAT